MEQAVIERLKQGKEDAFRYLYEKHYALLCHIARGYVNDRFLAETLVGDVIYHLWEVRESVNIQTSLRSYLVKSVRNHCLDYLSSKREQKEIAFCALSEDELIQNHYMPCEEYPLGLLLEKELENEIYKAIGRLPEECRIVFQKSRFEKKKYEEIASELNISVNTVKYHIKNALHLLGKQLSMYLGVLFLFFFNIR
ncbi:RNA polymerase sigma-70 factor [Bacteroides pyogenes]|jgi:RNA polymerase sigma-70 factor (ECF subfamily)|uniref:RNA polymerase sigma-70 factor n=1 Tax=Bacteroides pyogenes TaxID=310300 RepID=UPI001F3DA29B|nr:RNA polymerase sigma-70 factor [Bacteroides pyogenes]MCE9106027.1 RNA polymerase sigma-70 factor [Bacteroides pyogenes]